MGSPSLEEQQQEPPLPQPAVGQKRRADFAVAAAGQLQGVLAAQIEVFSELGGLEPEAQRARIVSSLHAQRCRPHKPRIGPEYQVTSLPEPRAARPPAVAPQPQEQVQPQERQQPQQQP